MNILAVNIARHKACPDIKTAGLYGQKRLKIYVSAEVTYPCNYRHWRDFQFNYNTVFSAM